MVDEVPNFPTETTLMSITGIELGPYSTRDLTMTLEPIPQSAQVERDINGNLIDLSEEQFRKYRVTISATDHESPVFAGVFPGHQFTVVCVPQLGLNRDTEDEQEVMTLTCLVMAPWQIGRREYAAQTTWQLVGEEV